MKLNFRTGLAVTLLWIGVSPVVAQWSTIKPGLERLDYAITTQGRRVGITILRCDPKKRSIKIVSVSALLGKDTELSAFSLRAVKNKTAAVATANAGSTQSLRFPVPAGWLVTDGKEVSRPVFGAPEGAFLCLQKSQVIIGPIDSENRKLPSCTDAVQRGPFLSAGFNNLVHASPDSLYRRTVAAVDDAGRLLILVTTNPASYAEIVSFLFSSEPPLGVKAALGLDGAASSGLIVQASKSNGRDSELGNVDFLIASAIVIE